ncbi:MAG TPA: ribonuclease III [Rhizobiales bacterium]|nr:ribonuclease 3 [bacterium BMS3Bbin10]HDO52260.1 ribonuclease III [Hyphomicrobiales bacterium]
MSRTSKKSLEVLAGTLGHNFGDPSLLQRALTHSSARAQGEKGSDYERLEFLGDRVLGLVIAELLFELFPDAREGALALRFNRLVRKETCAAVAQDINLGEYVIMSAVEASSGGRGKQTILGDACEAVLGAIFVDGGFEAARGVIRAMWSDLARDDNAVRRDAKSALQEWAQGRGLELPKYVETKRTGPDHAPQFNTRVEVSGLASAHGEGPSKRLAEQSAASAMLLREGVWKKDGDER